MSRRSPRTATLIALLIGGGCAPADGGVAMFHGGPAHGGATDRGTLAGFDRVAWRATTGGALRGSPTVSNGVVYVGSADGHLHAFDRTDGRRLWATDVGSPIASTPAVARGRIVIATRENAVVAIDLRGRIRWRVAFGRDLPLPWGLEGWDYYSSSPTVVDDLVFVGSGDGTVAAIALASGAVRWRAATEGRVRASPAVQDGRVIVGSSDGRLYAFAAATGAPLWRAETRGVDLDAAMAGFDRRQLQSSPTVIGDTVYVGSRDGGLYAIDARTGNELWRMQDHRDTTAWIVSTPAVAGDLLIVGRSGSRSVHGLDRRTGVERWRYAATDLVLASATVVGDAALITDGRGAIHALDVATGAARWRWSLGASSFATIAVDRGRAFIGADDGVLTAIDLGVEPAPSLAVYFDSTRIGVAAFGSAAAHRGVVAHLAAAGYQVLDRDAVAAYMRARRYDGGRSVVVFAMDDLPPTLDDASGRGGVVRAYLAAGGKVVWIGAPPGFYLFDSVTRQLAGVSKSVPTAITGVPHDSLNFDLTAAVATTEGERWGVGMVGAVDFALPVSPAMTVLAADEFGRAALWVRPFGGREGTGFVRFPGRLALADPVRVRRVAEFGIASR